MRERERKVKTLVIDFLAGTINGDFSSLHLNPHPKYNLSFIVKPEKHMQNLGTTSLIEPVKSKYYSS